MMKKIFGIVLCVLLISLCAFALADVKINSTNFPDEIFREYVRQFDTDGNGSFSNEELKKVKSINVFCMQISSLQGVEYFTELTELISHRNKLTSLDISKNIALTVLSCGNNPLTSLDVSKNTALKEISCNDAQLISLDVSKNSALIWLDCYCNQLTSLNISKNIALEGILCDFNQLSSLDVSKNTALETLVCGNNLLSSLDVSKNIALKVLDCTDNRLTSLKLGKALTKIRCSGNQLTSLDIRQCPELLKFVKGKKPTWHMTWGDAGDFGWCENPDNPFYTNYIIIDEGLKVISGEEIPVTQIKLNKTEATLTRASGKKKPTLQLKATVMPEDATDPSVEWKSSDPKIAKVDKSGKVTALKDGKVTITCTAKDGSGVKATCNITVKDQQVTKMSLNKKSLSLKKGENFQLKVTIKPADALNRKVKWISSNKKVATVDKNGKVRAVGKGSCDITCEALDDSGKMTNCKIIVK